MELIRLDMSVAGGHGDGHRHRGDGGGGGWRREGSRRVAVLALVGHDQHRRVVGGALHVLPRGASSHCATLVVAPENRIAEHVRSQVVANRDEFLGIISFFLCGLIKQEEEIYRGYGEPLMGFWPYFLHEYSSGGMSAIFELIAGTRIVLFTRFFLRKHTESNPP